DNGYRYYSLGQYFIFEIIVSLRKLGVSLKEIGNYVHHRDIESLQTLLLNKVLEYDLQIELLERNKRNILINVERLKQAKEVRSNRITLEQCEEEYFVADNFYGLKSSMKDQVKSIARHSLPFAKNEIFNEYFMGYILLQEALLSEEYMTITQIFTQVSDPGEYPKAVIKPKGFYAKIVASDGYHSNYKKIIGKMMDFIRLNNLKIVGNAYIKPLKNYWTTANLKEYVTQIAIQVDYIDSD
ncbi:MAG TPA: hypothetical protein VN611_04555, partial [Patescibacteria group bacterium]|nr:hypothetical protein [Patescibacteria group bacterium]